MASQFTAVFDACVLYPSVLRDVLLRLAITDTFRAKWTDKIHDEWTRNLKANRPDIDENYLNKTRQLMNAHVRDAVVEGFEHLIDSVQLPDQDDRHVVAAAIVANADVIVTYNLKDFPDEALTPYELQAIHPDSFIHDLIDLHPAEVIGVIRSARGALKKPSLTVDEYLSRLRKQRLPETVTWLESMKLVL
ncbi:PIN domain-containing protein [Endozoicomonas sp. ALC020]|uniref:PIN domain-containing protein n=1 Tax=unclassified Endozoicomonas TaxID=2644528 RepID=UPI003BB08EB9